MTRVGGQRTLLLLVLLASFYAGVYVDSWLRTSGAPKPAESAAQPSQPSAELTVAAASRPVNHLAGPADQRPIATAPLAAIWALPATPLRMPIDGVSIESFKGGFAETRGDRSHEAVDIIVPGGTPIHAVQDGTIAKLFYSKNGGLTIYQFEDGGPLCFYYAHLERYADDLHDGQHVSQGEVIGYVGTSGNAPPGTPHLHFGIFELNADRKWWQGRALDPYLVFKEKG